MPEVFNPTAINILTAVMNAYSKGRGKLPNTIRVGLAIWNQLNVELMALTRAVKDGVTGEPIEASLNFKSSKVIFDPSYSPYWIMIPKDQA